jgi:dihydroorotase-like cyclic amidohydrolase
VTADVVIRNGVVVGEGEPFLGGVAISDGVIVAVGPDSSLPAAADTFDARETMILPGVIDPHVHLGTGGTADERKLIQDFRNETAAAAAGGITCLVTNHENATGPSYITTTEHDTDGRTLLDRAKAIGERESLIDFRFTALPQTEEHLDEIPELLARGVTSFKFYPSYLGEEADDFGIRTLDWGFIYEAFERLADARKDVPAAMAMMHCEEPYICARLKKRLRQLDSEGSLAAWARSRPAACEAMQIYDAGLIARDTGCRLYVVHISSAQGTEAVVDLTARGADVVGETCTHYLMLTSEADLGRWAKVNPPIRALGDQERLWAGLADGALQVIGSDNSRSTAQEKLARDFWDAIPGFADMAATLPLLVSEGVLRRRLRWTDLTRLLSENAARYYGMYPRKGVLRAGSDGDVVVFDPEARWTLTPAALGYPDSFSIYDGRPVTGRPTLTFVRGRLVAERGKITVANGHGRYVSDGQPRHTGG